MTCDRCHQPFEYIYLSKLIDTGQSVCCDCLTKPEMARAIKTQLDIMRPQPARVSGLTVIERTHWVHSSVGDYLL